MPVSSHSHSGQFCGHAKNTLEEVVKTAISRKMVTFAMTEHMPRDEEDLYPEEVEIEQTAQGLVDLMDRYYAEAVRLRELYAPQIKLLVGFESEWIRPASAGLVERLLQQYKFDLFVGSVHHLHTIPIDFDRPRYEAARKVSGGTDERVFEDYFDEQHAMLQALKPPVVGHFDLIRLFSDDPDRSFRPMRGVWKRIQRNLEFIAGYGGLLELNSSAIRKGMSEPYPQVEICKAFKTLGGSFTLSDDSHGVEQVGLNYHRVFEALNEIGVQDIHFFERGGGNVDERFDHIGLCSRSVASLANHPAFAVPK